MNQVEASILRKNIQNYNITAKTLILSICTFASFNKKTPLNLLQFSV